MGVVLILSYYLSVCAGSSSLVPDVAHLCPFPLIILPRGFVSFTGPLRASVPSERRRLHQSTEGRVAAAFRPGLPARAGLLSFVGWSGGSRHHFNISSVKFGSFKNQSEWRQGRRGRALALVTPGRLSCRPARGLTAACVCLRLSGAAGVAGGAPPGTALT